MDAKQIVAVESMANRLTRHARALVESAGALDALKNLDSLVAEVRFYAVGVDELRKSVSAGVIDAARAEELRKDYVARLLTAVAPDA